MAGGTSRRRGWHLKSWFLRGYRAGVLCLIVWMLHQHHFEVSRTLTRSISLTEVQEFLPDAYQLRHDPSPRSGLLVYDYDQNQIGYALSTFPLCQNQVGYCGPTEVLVVLGPPVNSNDEKLLGFAIRYSGDTKSHVQDVLADQYYMEQLNGFSWQEIAELDFKENQIEGVSGATMTSMNMAYGIQDRLADSMNKPPKTSTISWSLHDWGTILVLCWGTLFAFASWRRNRYLQLGTSILMIVYFGFINGDLIAVALLGGWAQNGIPWQLAPGLTLMVAAAFLLPWISRRPVYCSHICPHGTAQQLLARWSPWKIALRADVKRGLLWIRPLLLLMTLVVLFTYLNFDLAGIEPFDAYLLGSAGTATIVVALVGLLFSCFIPMGYCKYGCPTGTLLEFVRSHGRADRFHLKDKLALLFVIFTWLLKHFHTEIQSWLHF